MMSFGSQANPLRKKRRAKEVEEDVPTTTKKQKLVQDLLKPKREEKHELEKKEEEADRSNIGVDRLKHKRSDEILEASFSRRFNYLENKVPLSTNQLEKQRKASKDLKGFVLPPALSPKKALRATAIKIRFADTIVKSKYRKLIDESSNKVDVMKRIQREKQLLEKRLQEEKTKIEDEIRATGLKLRHEVQLAIKKREEEARSNFEEEHLVVEKEMVNLCGGSYLARTRWVEKFGLFLKSDDCGLEEIERKSCEFYL